MKSRILVLAGWLIVGGIAAPAAAQVSEDQRKTIEEQKRAIAEAKRASKDAARAAREAQRRVFLADRGGSFLGIGVADIDSERAKALNLREERGVEVKSVEADSPAAKAGLKNDDVVLDFNGERVEGTEQFMRLVRETPPGRVVKLMISRGGNTQTITATLGKRKGAFAFAGPREFEFEMPEMPEMPPMPPMGPMPPVLPDIPRAYMSLRSSRLGVETESLGSQLAEYFGVKEGVLVRSVTKGSPAEKAGLKAGDVIVKVDGESVTSPREISNTLRTVRGKKTLQIGAYRDRKPITVTVTLDDSSTQGRRAFPDVPVPPTPAAPIGAFGFVEEN